MIAVIYIMVKLFYVICILRYVNFQVFRPGRMLKKYEKYWKLHKNDKITGFYRYK